MRDLAQGQALKAEGQGRVASGADREAYVERSLKAIKTLCQTTACFNADDVFEAIPPKPKTIHPNILSTLMKKAATEGYCVRLMFSTLSERPNQHATSIFWYGSRLAGNGLRGCRRCNSTGLIHETDHDAGLIYTEVCDCPVGRDEQFRQVVFDYFEGKNG